MSTHSQCNYVNPNSISLDWECLIISKTDMLLDGVPKELINKTTPAIVKLLLSSSFM